MEQSFFALLFVVAFIIFLISIFWTKDTQLQGIFAGISFIFFAILTIQSFNIESILYDPNTGDFIYYRVADHSLEYLVPMGICLVFMIFSLLNVFIIFSFKAWNRAIIQKPMNIGDVNGNKKLF